MRPQLCELCEKDKAAISRTVAELEESGLIRRLERNGTYYRAALVLTEAGQEAATAVSRKAKQAVELAGEYAGKGVLLADLIQEGSAGLWADLKAYTQGSLEQFRDASLRRHMVRTVILQAYAAGAGQKLRQALEDYRAVDERLLTELGRNPTLEEIAQAMHLNTEQAAVVAQMVANARNLNRAQVPEPEEAPEESQQAVEDTAYFQMRQRISELLSSLDETSVRLLTLRYGLEGGAPLTPEQTGKELGMTPQEVVAAEAAALSKLRKQ